MNIEIEKKKYMPPYMEIMKLDRVANLLSSSEPDDDHVDIEEIEGYDDEFG